MESTNKKKMNILYVYIYEYTHVGFFRSPLVASWASPGYLLGSLGSLWFLWLPFGFPWTPLGFFLGVPWRLLGSIWYLWGFIGGPVGRYLGGIWDPI